MIDNSPLLPLVILNAVKNLLVTKIRVGLKQIPIYREIHSEPARIGLFRMTRIRILEDLGNKH